MRKDNYFIAMINRDVLDLTVPVPILRNRPLFTRTLEWNINLCIMKYVFDEQGQMRSVFIRDTHRRLLSDGYVPYAAGVVLRADCGGGLFSRGL